MHQALTKVMLNTNQATRVASPEHAPGFDQQRHAQHEPSCTGSTQHMLDLIINVMLTESKILGNLMCQKYNTKFRMKFSTR